MLFLHLLGCGYPVSFVEGTISGRVDGQVFEGAFEGEGLLGSGAEGTIITFEGKSSTTTGPRELEGLKLELNEVPEHVLGAGPLSIESWFLNLGGLITSSDGTDVPVVLDTTDATWLGDGATPWEATGTLTGTIPLEEGAGDVTLNATFGILPDCKNSALAFCGSPDDSPATTWDALMSTGTCAPALIEATLPAGDVEYKGHELRFGEDLELECVKTTVGRICGVEQPEVNAEGCTWKVLTLANVSLSTVLIAAYATPSCTLDPNTCLAAR